MQLRCCDRSAQWSVPLVIAAGPGEHRVDGRQRSYQVVDGPANDGVVVHAHVDIYHADSITHACWRTNGKLC